MYKSQNDNLDESLENLKTFNDRSKSVNYSVENNRVKSPGYKNKIINVVKVKKPKTIRGTEKNSSQFSFNDNNESTEILSKKDIVNMRQ